jgi:intraflagellar transport protein 80
VADPSLWAVLAAVAMEAGELQAAEAAFVASGAADKLAFVRRAAGAPVPEVRAAELALYRGRVAEAEALLLQVRRGCWGWGGASRGGVQQDA